MEMPSSFLGDKHEFCLTVIKFKHKLYIQYARTQSRKCTFMRRSVVHLRVPSNTNG